LKVAVAVLIFLAGIFTPAVESGAASCGASIEGGVYGTGTYGGSGSTTACPTPASGGRATTAEREVLFDPVCAGTPDARLEVVRVYDTASGVLLRTERNCVGPNIPGDPAPVPPSVTDVMQRLPLPMPEIHTSPRNRGLVGVETWLWWGGEDTPPPVVIGVDGWTATVQPRLARIEWDMGNGDVVEGNGPGSEAQPSATYVYERQCDCTITVTLVWAGSVTFSHPLVPAALVQESPGVPFTTSMPYEVEEREAVIVR
jgi:hypothetical protein